MALLHQLLRLALLAHGLFNVLQGSYCILDPSAFASAAGSAFQGSSDQALQSIGLGSIGVGVYGTLGALTNDRRFYAVTTLMRIVFGIVAFTQWGWAGHSSVVLYEGVVAVAAAVASLT